MKIETEQKPGINWDAVLQDYGPKAKLQLNQLLSEYDISDTDPVAALIASMFISHMDTLQAFNSISEVISQGKHDLSTEFKEQILALRGIIAFAQEHLIDSGEEQIEKRQADLLDVVKEGIRKALLRSEAVSHARNTGGLLIAVGITGLMTAIAGVSGVIIGKGLSPTPVVAVPQESLWPELEAKNKQTLEACLQNRAELEGRSIIQMD
ncbi:MAG: hypothetical protein AAGE59_34870 [Cyanobacteria bacterium P01_F01_bin.86]